MNAVSIAVTSVGGRLALAQALQVSREAVRKWIVAGEVPAKRVLAIYRATRGAVTPHELRPDIYPDPDYRPVLDEPAATAPAAEAAA